MTRASLTDEYQVTALDHFVQIPAWLVMSDVSPAALKLYAVLRRKADNQTGQRFQTLADLGQLLGGRSKDYARKAVRELQNIGALDVRERYAEREQLANLYTVLSRPFEGARPPRQTATTPSPASKAPHGQSTRAPLATQPHRTKNPLTNNPLTPSADDESPAGPKCPTHGFDRSYGCRGCGTTKRQLAAAAREAERAAAPRRCSECLTLHPLDDMTRVGDENRLVCRDCLPAA